MQGEFSNANVVAHIAKKVPVAGKKFVWEKVPDYAAETNYFIRMGTEKWWR
jgi:hypothetical protein